MWERLRSKKTPKVSGGGWQNWGDHGCTSKRPLRAAARSLLPAALALATFAALAAFSSLATLTMFPPLPPLPPLRTTDGARGAWLAGLCQ